MLPSSAFRSRSKLTLTVVALVSACSSGGDFEAAPGEDEAGSSGKTWTKDNADIVTPPNDGAASCAAPSVFFPDHDGDGFGRTADGVRACEKPPGQWASAGGDCADFEPRAHPAQRVYFPEPYTSSTGESTFDYDCNDYEDSDPRQPGGAPSCLVLSITECGGAGYIATERAGEGVNVLCGSRSTLTCKPNTLGFLCGPVHAMVDAALRCH